MTDLKIFGDTAKGLAKNPLGIIALFIVLIYGFATLLVAFSNRIQPNEQSAIVWFLISFPFIVIVVFGWLVSRHHEKLYAPKDYSDEESFVRSFTNRAKSGQDISHLDLTIEEKIREQILSPEFVKKLQTPPENLIDILTDAVHRTTSEIRKSEFISIKFSDISGKEDDVHSVPISTYNSINELTNEIFFHLYPKIRAFSYGHDWVLFNENSQTVIKLARMITGSGVGRPIKDLRTLEEVGINPGDTLVVTCP